MIGYGHGYGSGYGSGYDSGYGSGSGSGCGYGSGYGNGTGYGHSSGPGDDRWSHTGIRVGDWEVQRESTWGLIQIGCKIGTLEWWCTHWRELVEEHEIDPPAEALALIGVSEELGASHLDPPPTLAHQSEK